MSDNSQTTTNHEEIKKWAEERGGKPAIVKGTENSGEGAGLLRIDFEGKDDSLEHVSWDEFFKTFDEKHLAFIYQNQTSGGDESRFFKFVSQ